MALDEEDAPLMATGEGLGTSAAYALDPEQTPHTYLELGSLPTAVPCARLHVKHVLREWQMVGLADVPPEIKRKFISDKGHFLIQIHPAVNIWDRDGAARFVADLRTVDPTNDDDVVAALRRCA